MKKNNIVRCCIVSSSVLSTCLYNCACGCSNTDPSNSKSYIVKALGIKESDILKEINFINQSGLDITEFDKEDKYKDCFFVFYVYYKKNKGVQEVHKLSFFVIKGDLNKLNIDSSIIREVKNGDKPNEEELKKKEHCVFLYMSKDLNALKNLIESIKKGEKNIASGDKLYISV